MAIEQRPAPTPTKTEEETKREPIILDLGKKNRRQVRKLKKGKPGRLMNRVEDAIEHLRENGAITETTQAVVIVIRQRAKRRGNRRLTKAWGLG